MWKKIDVVFKLKAPLHIGYLPFKGSVVSPTRYYVSGRNFWGAVTKRITEYLYEKPKGEHYKKIGHQIMENLRFSYFYLYDGRVVYFPRYTDKGVKYGNNKEEITKAEFEHRFIGSIISTAIDSESSTAKYGSLHEIEFINNKFRDENGEFKDVKIAGSIWVKKNTEIENENKKVNLRNEGAIFNIIQELILGGESKYGFGRVLLESVNKIKFPDVAPFKWGDDPEKITIKLGESLISHLKYDKGIKFQGDVELFTGRGFYDPKKLKDTTEGNDDICSNNSSDNKKESEGAEKPGRVISKPECYFSPGTILQEDINCKLNWDGTLEECHNAPH